MALKNVEFHMASDRRYYYGAACSDLQKEIDSVEDARKALKESDYNITYFPNGGFYVGFYKNNVITQDCQSFESCYSEIVKIENDKDVHLPFTCLSLRG